MRNPRLVKTEFMKLRRSRVTWISFAVYAFMAAICGFLLWVMMNPSLASRLGLLGRKARFAFGGGALDWRTFLAFILQMAGIGGLIMSAVIVTYVFGREYAEGTAKNMLGLPIPRGRFVFAKLFVSGTWFAVLNLGLIVETWAVGMILHLPGFSAALFLATAGRILLLSFMSLSCATVVAWVAVASQGYFAPLGFSIFTLVLASIFGSTGWGPWIPWSIIGIYAEAAGPNASLGWGSFVVIALTGLVGTTLVVRNAVRADNRQ
ncbi:MAG: ABC transporter permease [Acidobacteriota bacterium]|nr:ABC transporter permease [Acidobacteriota bacterium]